ncbi:MAG TPA: response regulator transcription factor [Bryobacteraceae bacterium]|nr:response regulator transcription factor [Bryobacteraceae bacterium]
MRVLVAEDKPRMARFLRRALTSEGNLVTVASDGDEALALALADSVDVLVLDVMLPRRDGFEVIRELRAAGLSTPTIMLTARDAICDIVRGLDLGADDYLTKPFALEVLLARVRALHRRNPVTYPPDLKFEDLRLRTNSLELIRGERMVGLTRTEYALLETLMRRAGSVVPKQTLVEAAWDSDSEVADNTLHVFISALRSHIAMPGEKQLLHTVRGIGYTLRADVP